MTRRENKTGQEADMDDLDIAGTVEAYRENLIFFLNRYTRNLDAAEDIAQDTFLELFVNAWKYNGRASVKTYLFAIGRHKALNYIRHMSKLNIVPLDCDCVITDEYACFEEKIMRDEKRRLLNGVLDRLPEDYSTVLHLIYFEEMSYAEAGRILKMNRKQIENLVFRARKKLKGALEDENEERV